MLAHIIPGALPQQAGYAAPCTSCSATPGREEHPQVGAGAPVLTPCATPSLPSHADFPPFRSICPKDSRSLSSFVVPGMRQAVMSWVTCPAKEMLPLLSFEEFLAAQLRVFFCRKGTKERRSNLKHTQSQKADCQQTWVRS